MYKVGSKVKSFALPNGKTGTIIKKYDDRKGYNGEALYDILDENGQIHTMVDTLFESAEIITIPNEEELLESQSNEQTTSYKIDIEIAKQEIEKRIDEIISELGLEKSDDIMVQLKNCCLVQKYIVLHNNYDSSIMLEKEKYDPKEFVVLDLYNAVMLQNGVCTSNSLMFKKILREVGINVEVIGLISNATGGMHASNVVELDGEYYFFDSTLEGTIYKENGYKTGGEVVLCCAGMGKNEYCRYYTPKVVLPDDPLSSVSTLPNNIADSRIPVDIVNGTITTGINNKL